VKLVKQFGKKISRYELSAVCVFGSSYRRGYRI